MILSFNQCWVHSGLYSTMKAFTVILFLLFLSIPTFAQRITYSDLLYMLRHTVEESDDYLSEKGFSFSGVDTIKNDNDELLSAVSYSYHKNSKYSTSYMSIEKKSNRDIFYEVSFYSLLQTDYAKFKANVKALGFIANGTEVSNSGLVNYFTKGNLEVSFMQHKLTKEGVDDVTDYYITLTDKSLMRKIWNLVKGNQ